MKYLQDYVEEEQTKLFNELGVFFAFNDEQFKEGAEKNKDKKPEDTKWASCGMGMFMPSVNVAEFLGRSEEIAKSGIEQDLKDNGREGVLERELGNYEIGLSYDGYNDPNFRDGIAGYDFTEEEIKAAFNKHMQEHEY